MLLFENHKFLLTYTLCTSIDAVIMINPTFLLAFKEILIKNTLFVRSEKMHRMNFPGPEIKYLLFVRSMMVSC